MKNYRIDFTRLVRQLLPDHKRQRVRLGLLGAFAGPLTELFAAFDAWRGEIRRAINLTSQQGVLQEFLRAKYDAPTLTILSYRDTGFACGLRPEGVGVAAAFGCDKTEGTPAIVPLRGERREQFGGVDFLVRIPPQVDIEHVRADIEKYRAALTTYNIEQA